MTPPGWLLVATLLAGACTPLPDTDRAPAGESARGTDQGSLRLDQVSITLRTPEISVRVTPLAGSVVRLLAEDAAARLRALAAEHAPGADDRALLLVTFSAIGTGPRFAPSDLRLSVAGRRLEVRRMEPLTTGWGEERIGGRGSEAALYLLTEPLDAFAPFEVTYGDARSEGWRDVIPRLRAEEDRIRRSTPP